jgi:hypothetical protein
MSAGENFIRQHESCDPGYQKESCLYFSDIPMIFTMGSLGAYETLT